MDNINELIEIVNKRFCARIDLDEYKRISFFSTAKGNNFQKFLSEYRVNVFLRLAILYKYGLDGKFACGNLSNGYYDKYEEEPELTETGPSLIKETFTGKELFNYLLDGLGISQLLIKEKFHPEGKERFDKNGTVPKIDNNAFSEYFQESFFVMIEPAKRLVLGENEVWVEPEIKEETELIIRKQFEPLFDWFLDAAKNKTEISHDGYVGWLLKWFPGMVHVRAIE